MAPEAGAQGDGALAPFAPGPTFVIAGGALEVEIAPEAGGRIAQIRHAGLEQLLGHGPGNEATIAWGCYPMLPWAGRIRNAAFDLDGAAHRLQANLGAHAIHGVGFALPWRVEARDASSAVLSLALPEDRRWPFGGVARQHFGIDGDRLRMRLAVTAGAVRMPVVLGWHPWFLKPERLEFRPGAMYPRDAEGIAVRPTVTPTPGPWDDCFLNDEPVVLHRGGRRLRLSSDCTHWVVFDERAQTTCVEPQSGPPDGPTLGARVLAPGETLEAWFEMAWE
ncbi:aldose epimerase [Coralloluteibacterium stylophorae]|uniref:Aldose epimerase n=1 Tax=Coralloluteibacterium stylophorae TaxID=1776034 RepID=A0A8J7VTN6_9GAMM|nr:aldose epimerase [Coralloluteibacterium stylophorae]MBS7458601.1 aldose epimerase [Coralloluteibacterium stylophorae]